jgi:hypothetical protein
VTRETGLQTGSHEKAAELPGIERQKLLENRLRRRKLQNVLIFGLSAW